MILLRKQLAGRRDVLFQAEMMSVTPHMIIAFPRVNQIGKDMLRDTRCPAKRLKTNEKLGLSDRTIVQV